MFDDFKNRWLGRRVADPLLVGNGETQATMYQCVSLVKQYMVETKNLRVDWPGNAIQFWTQTKQEILSAFHQVSNSETQKGDIVVLWGLNGNPYGHIGIATGGLSGTTVEILEQNGQLGSGTGTGGDAIRTRWVARSRVAGLLRPNVVSAPALNPIRQYTSDGSHEMVTNKQPTNWWNLNETTMDINSFRAAAVLNIGTPFTIGGFAHHINGHTYAMTLEDYNRAINGNLSTNNGVNIRDLDPKPIPVYVPPAPPAAPVEVKKAEQYTLVTEVVYFKNYKDALYDQNALGVMKKGTYYVFARDNNMVNLTDNNMQNQDKWINPDMNKLEEPAPLPPKMTETIENAAKDIPVVAADTTPLPTEAPEAVINGKSWKVCTPLRPDWRPVSYISTNSLTVQIRSLDGKTPATISLPPHTKLQIVSTFDNGKYARDTLLNDRRRFYALPMEMLKPVLPPARRMDYNHDGDVNISDFIDYGGRLFKSGVTVVTDVAKSIKTKQFIDGFRATNKDKDKVQ